MADILWLVVGFWGVVFGVIALMIAWKTIAVIVGLPMLFVLILLPETRLYALAAVGAGLFIWARVDEKNEKVKKKRKKSPYNYAQMAIKVDQKEATRLREKSALGLPPLSKTP